MKGLKVKLVKKIKRAREKDEELVKVVEKARIKVLREDKQKIKEELVLKKKKIQKQLKDNRINNKKLLVARSDKEYRKIYRKM